MTLPADNGDEYITVTVQCAMGVVGVLTASRHTIAVQFCYESDWLRDGISAESEVSGADETPWRLALAHCIEYAACDLVRQLWRHRHCGNREHDHAVLGGISDAVYALKTGGLGAAQMLGDRRGGGGAA